MRAIAAVKQRQQPAARHDQATSPYPAYKRLVIEPHDPGRFIERISKRHVKIAEQAGIDGGLGHGRGGPGGGIDARSEEHTSELQSLMRISYDVFCLKKKRHKN